MISPNDNDDNVSATIEGYAKAVEKGTMGRNAALAKADALGTNAYLGIKKGNKLAWGILLSYYKSKGLFLADIKRNKSLSFIFNYIQNLMLSYMKVESDSNTKISVPYCTIYSVLEKILADEKIEIIPSELNNLFLTNIVFNAGRFGVTKCPSSITPSINYKNNETVLQLADENMKAYFSKYINIGTTDSCNPGSVSACADALSSYIKQDPKNKYLQTYIGSVINLNIYQLTNNYSQYLLNTDEYNMFLGQLYQKFYASMSQNNQG